MPLLNEFDQDQVDSIYNLITAGNSEFIAMMAKAAIQQALEVKTDMWNESDDAIQERPLFDESDVRAHAHDFTSDMMSDFSAQVKSAIKDSSFNAGIHRIVKFDLRFNN